MTPEISVALRQLREALDIPTVGQSDAMCGPASLKAALKFYGVDVPEAMLKRLSDASTRDGTSPQGLAQAAIDLGFDAEVRQHVTFDELRAYVRDGVAVVVDWFDQNMGHYSVVKDVTDDTIVLMDPSDDGSTRRMKLADFEKVWFDFMDWEMENPTRRLAIVVRPRR